MSFTTDNRSTYSFKDHYFLFISLIYSFIIFSFFNSWGEDIHSILKKFLINMDFDPIKNFSFESFAPFFIASSFMVYVIESWWASQLDSRYINRFRNFVYGLGQPLFLYVIIIFLSHTDFRNVPIIKENMASFNILLTSSICYILYVRAKFNGSTHFFNSVPNKYRFGGILLAFVFSIYWIFYSEKCSKNFNIAMVYINGSMLIVGMLWFIKAMRAKETFRDRINEDEFVDEVLPMANLTERNSQHFAILLIDGLATSAYRIKKNIISRFRKDVIVAINRQGIHQIFIPCIDDMDAVEKKLMALEKNNKKAKMTWEFRELKNAIYSSKDERIRRQKELQNHVISVYECVCKNLQKE